MECTGEVCLDLGSKASNNCISKSGMLTVMLLGGCVMRIYFINILTCLHVYYILLKSHVNISISNISIM